MIGAFNSSYCIDEFRNKRMSSGNYRDCVENGISLSIEHLLLFLGTDTHWFSLLYWGIGSGIFKIIEF